MNLDKKIVPILSFLPIIDMNRQIPRAFYINAQLEKIKNVDLDEVNIVEFEEYLTDLEEDRENRPFLDKIYYRIAEFHRMNGGEFKSELYYNKSVRVKSVRSISNLTQL